MYVLENPVLQRELLVNLRMVRGFVLMFVYQGLLAVMVYLAWPQDQRLDLSQRPETARNLVDVFFLSQYVLASLMAPSFAAGAITGEKERHTYEMLLASPLRPGAIVVGKWIASLAYLAVLIVGSLPIIMLCLPLGGVSAYEVFAAYLALLASVLAFGAIAIACSSYFQRTAASLVVSYLIILPLAMAAILFWSLTRDWGSLRLLITVTAMPVAAAVTCVTLFARTAARLLHPPDVGSEGKEVIDLEREAQQGVGLVIHRDHFPDRLFAPAKRTTLLDDRANPVYDKEIRSEIFSHGTLMLRLVILISMLVAIPLMGYCLFYQSMHVPWYVAYVILFNMLVGPVFSAGSVTSERERQTLDLLLTTTITPWQILSGKLWAGLRVSSVLTLLLLWPLVLACLIVPHVGYWQNLPSIAAYLAIILLTCQVTALIALFCSVLFHKTSTSMMATYLSLIALFCAPLAADFFADTFYADQPVARRVEYVTMISPIAAVFAVPLSWEPAADGTPPVNRPGNWGLVAAFGGCSIGLSGLLLLAMVRRFRTRWRVAE